MHCIVYGHCKADFMGHAVDDWERMIFSNFNLDFQRFVSLHSGLPNENKHNGS